MKSKLAPVSPSYLNYEMHAGHTTKFTTSPILIMYQGPIIFGENYNFILVSQEKQEKAGIN